MEAHVESKMKWRRVVGAEGAVGSSLRMAMLRLTVASAVKPVASSSLTCGVVT